MPINRTNLEIIKKTTEIGKVPNKSIENKESLVTVGFEGLGILCFAKTKSKKTKIIEKSNKLLSSNLSSEDSLNTSLIPARGEIAIIRQENHSLKITITTLDENGIESDMPEELFGFPSQARIPDDVEISIKATVNPVFEGYEKQISNKTINRTTYTDQNQFDIRWLIDIENELHNKKLVPIKSSTKLSKLYIENAEFYSRSFLLNKNGTSPQPQIASFVTGSSIYVGHELGAKIQAEVVELSIKGQNLKYSFQFLKSSNKRYLVKIQNTCDIENGDGDFNAVYKFLNDESNNPFTLRPDLNSSSTTSTNSTGKSQMNKTKNLPNNTNKPEEMTRVRFCGVLVAGQQDGISDIINAQK